MTFKVGYKQIEFKPLMIRYFCDDCGFEHWDEKVIPKLKCHCQVMAEHEEWEG